MSRRGRPRPPPAAFDFEDQEQQPLSQRDGVPDPTRPEPEPATKPATDEPPAKAARTAGGPSPPHYKGHRERVRKRLLAAGAETFADYELLELLLFYSIERVDVKPLAKALLAEFGSLGAVLAAPPERLQTHDKIGERTCVHFKVVREAVQRLLKEGVVDRPVVSSWDQLLDYCRIAMADEQTERFRVLFLDRKNRIIRDEVQQRGTVDHTPVYPREVLKRALELGASALILVHNHPSGDATPSVNDIEMTRELSQAGGALGVAVHDHVIVAKGGVRSFRASGLL